MLAAHISESILYIHFHFNSGTTYKLSCIRFPFPQVPAILYYMCACTNLRQDI